MKKSDFSNSMVEVVSEYIQTYLNDNKIDFLYADDCSDILAKNEISCPKLGLYLQEMLQNSNNNSKNKILNLSKYEIV